MALRDQDLAGIEHGQVGDQLARVQALAHGEGLDVREESVVAERSGGDEEIRCHALV
jgi:hypothetical protein